MARFEVFASPDGDYWLDCQSDLLSGLNSRFVVPMRPVDDVPDGDRRLNPVFPIRGVDHVMQTHLAAAVSTRLLADPVTSLVEYEYIIGRAIDVLTGSY